MQHTQLWSRKLLPIVWGEEVRSTIWGQAWLLLPGSEHPLASSKGPVKPVPHKQALLKHPPGAAPDSVDSRLYLQCLFSGSCLVYCGVMAQHLQHAKQYQHLVPCLKLCNGIGRITCRACPDAPQREKACSGSNTVTACQFGQMRALLLTIHEVFVRLHCSKAHQVCVPACSRTQLDCHNYVIEIIIR